MACYSCRKKSAAPGPFSVVEAGLPAAVSAVAGLAADAASLPGVIRAVVEHGECVLHADVDAIPALMMQLRDDPRYAFEQFMDLCGVDWPERTPRFDVVYNLLSVSRNHRIRVVAGVGDLGSVGTISHIWPVATWWERECWDMYGIRFAGQADHRRILTDYGFDGHPLRKDFPLTGYTEVRYDEERKAVIYEPVQLQQDFRNFDFISPWEGMTTLPGDEKAETDRQA